MTTSEVVPIRNLELDIANPRLPRRDDDLVWSQPLVLQHFAQHRGTQPLARTIVREGMLNPSKRLIVMPSSNPKKYIVLEGNRRLAALRLLHHPELAASVALSRSFNSIATTGDRIPNAAECLVVQNRAKAAPWISMEHASGDDGATVKWETHEKERFSNLMSRGSARHRRALQLADLLLDSGQIDSKTFKAIPITSLDRLLSDPDVRSRLGANEFDDSMPDLGRRAAVRIVKELANKSTKVAKIMTKSDRTKYINEVMRDPDVIKAPPVKLSKKTAAVSQARIQRDAWERKNIVPAEFRAKVTDKKLRAILNELRGLNLDDFPHAGAI
jgi:hypothetical protein